MGNLVLYPVPKCSYQYSKEDPTLIFIPHSQAAVSTVSTASPSEPKPLKKIPCRFIPCQTTASPYLLVFFHGNSEDIGMNLSYLLAKFEERFGMNVLCPEYPTYGLYKKKDEGLDLDKAMLEDARWVLKYCHTKLRFEYKKIILIGRSLGTAIATVLATEFKLGGMVLISPFTTVREVAKNLVGTVLSKLVPDVFRSIDCIEHINCPVLFIHGKEDALIPFEMAVKLHEKAKGEKEIVINKEMSHNHFKMEADVFVPVFNFMREKLGLEEFLSKHLDRYYEMFC